MAADDRVVAVALRQAHGRHDDDPVRVDAAGLVGLGAADHDPVVAPLDDAEVEVGVGLLGRALAAVALGVGHRAADDEVQLLHAADERAAALVIGRAVLLVDLVGHRIQRVDGVHADAALEAGAGELAEAALHAVLRHHVVRALGDVQEAVHRLAAEARVSQGQLRLGHREVVGGRHGVDGRPDHRVVDRLLDPLAEEVDLEAAAAQALDVAPAVSYGLRHAAGGGEVVRPDVARCHGVPPESLPPV